jgi:hypothetical protein
MTVLDSLPELEYPHVPHPRTVFAGPILTPTKPVSTDNYPEIAAFLDRGRTILINLGSLFTYTEADAYAIAEAIVQARAHSHGRGSFQVLWKLRELKQFKQLIREQLGEDMEGVRLETWIDPLATLVLQHPNMSAAVHHGGASKCLALSLSTCI